jgi:type IV pilus assembly protein PilO
MALPAFLEPIVNAPKWQKSLFGVIGLAAIGGATYALLLSPLLVQLGTLRSQHAQLERDIAQNRAVVADLARFKRLVGETEQKLATLREKLPTEKETPPLYRSLSDAASTAGLGVALFEPKDARPRDYYNEIPIILKAEGGYHQLGEFFQRVAGLPRVVNVTEWKFGTSKDSKKPVAAELMLATYTYRPPGAAPAAKPATPATPAAAPVKK